MAVKLFWWDLKREDGKDNFGDLLSKYIVDKISKSTVIKVPHPSMRRYKYFIKHYLAIGSILEVANTNSVIWGSGIIRENQFVKKAKFLAVRGPRTRKQLLRLGYKVPERYGDPALLLPDFYPLKVEKKHKLGIIPHYVNYKEVNDSFKGNDNVEVIDLMTSNVEETLDGILKCNQIISSSLHGVIVSQAYGIPSLWVKFSKKLAGDNVKFYDYFESVGIKYTKEFDIDNDKLNQEYLEKLLLKNKSVLLPNEEMLGKRKEDLIKSCPFNKFFKK